MQTAHTPTRRSLFNTALTVVGLMCSLALPTAAQAQSPNLASNPGFEGTGIGVNECANITGVVAPGWSDNTCWDETKPQIAYAVDAASPRSGAQSQRISLVAGSRVQFVQQMPPVTPSNAYRATVWLRGQAGMEVTLVLREAGAPYRGFGSKLVALNNSWQAFEFQGVALASDMLLMVVAKEPGTLWVDDAVVVDAGPVPNVPPVPPAAAVPRDYFGIHFNYADTSWPQTGTVPAAVRIWDAGPRLDRTGPGAQWADINPQPGVFDWSGLDARVAAAEARGADVVYTLGGRTPQWASSRPDAPTPYGPGSCAEPSSEALWQDWVRTITTRYKGRIRYWEVWNEPDIAWFYCGPAARLVDLSRLTKQVVSAVDPAARVVSPSMSGYEGAGALDFFLASGGAQHVDIIGYHFYVPQPEDVTFIMADVKAVLQRNGAQNLPLWNTEQGWIDLDPPLDVFAADTGAAYVARSMLLGWAWGQQRFYFYTWDSTLNQIPLTTSDRRTLSTAGVAYREVSGWMLGRTMQSVQRDGAGNYTITLADAGGTLRRVMWNPDASGVAFAPPLQWGARQVRDLQGGTRSLKRRSTVRVGPSPVLIE